MNHKIKRALISVTDKSGLEYFAGKLSEKGIEIIASGGTAKAISRAGIAVTEISDMTGFPECMDGRVKTLHPKVHGGILADRGKNTHLQQAGKLGIGLIDLVAVNLYRFREAAADSSLDEGEKVEQIDIGGPALIRSAAKNFHSVTVIVDPADYESVISEMEREGGSTSLQTRRLLASKAFHHTASYDAAISSFFEGMQPSDEPPPEIITAFRRKHSLRYGENPQQKAVLYVSESSAVKFGDFVQHQGKELSYNNIQDMWAAFLLGRDLGPESCAIIKHTNPCGAAVCAGALESFIRARQTDPSSAFGSVISINGIVDEKLAAAMGEGFVEVLLARGYTPEAMEVFGRRKNLRILTVPQEEWDRDLSGWVGKEAGDLLLMQERDTGFGELEKLEFVTSRKPSPEELKAMALSWKIVAHVKSNGIVLCDQWGTVGVGAGQMSRVDSCRIAVDKAKREGLTTEGTSAGSDAFFPFPDGVEILAKAGVKCIIQPGGSIRDAEAIEAAERLGLTMAITGVRHFRH